MSPKTAEPLSAPEIANGETPPPVAPWEDPMTVRAFLLQRHHTLLARLGHTQLLFNGMMFVLVGFIAVVPQFSGFTLAAGLLLICTLVFHWRSQSRHLTDSLVRLEESIVRKAGGPWEDAYIRSQVTREESYTPGVVVPGGFEQGIWLIASVGVCAFRVIETWLVPALRS